MKIMLSLLAALLFAGCGTSNESKNLAVAQSMFEAFNKHDWKKMSSFYADDALFLDPSFGIEYVKKTRGETTTKYTELQQLFPNIHDEVVGMYASGDKVTVEFISTGTMGDSLEFKLPIVAVLTFNDGRIIKDATYYDLETQ